MKVDFIERRQKEQHMLIPYAIRVGARGKEKKEQRKITIGKQTIQ